jgi:UPF0755 protein
MIRGCLALLATLFFAGLVLTGAFVWDAFLASPVSGATPVSFVINKGESVKVISERLQEEGLLESAYFFTIYVWLTGTQADFQSGLFSLEPGLNFHALVSALTSAKAQEVQVTFPEGYTLKNMEQILSASFSDFSAESWEQATGVESELFTAGTHVLSGIPQGQGLEGYLFPDTYRFSTSATPDIIAETMVLTLKRRLSEAGVVIPDDLIMTNGLTFHEMLTLASIVEKEAATPEDMKIVADIFLTRLEIGMALQACSTINYLTGKNDPAVSAEDQTIVSPYNTYQVMGLPPGPISNPGMNAILAVLEPTPTAYLYFLTTPQGEMKYAQTYDEHVANKQKYLK